MSDLHKTIDRNMRLVSDNSFETAAKACEILGDAEFERLCKRGTNAGLATLAQRHYTACAEAIRKLKHEIDGEG